MPTTSTARTLSRVALRSFRSTPAVTFRSTASHARPQPKLQAQTARRPYSSSTGSSGRGSKGLLYGGVGVLVAAAGAGGYYFYNTAQQATLAGAVAKAKSDIGYLPKKEDFQAVYNDIAKHLVERDEYDDGSYGPVLVRLAWHCSGTYDKETKTGGSNGATMRFSPESDHGANSGLRAARDFLEPVKEKHPWITYSDLWTLAGVCAFQEMGGPVIPWRPGRTDRDVAYCTPDGRLPDASKEHRHLRAIFGRMGFNDQEIVALSGAHALGRCHTDRSGFSGPWTFSPTELTNDYYKLLMEEKWGWKKWNGPAQYEDKKTKSLMMLPTDYALIKDKEFKQHVEKYAESQEVFFEDFKNVIVKLFELGVPFKQEERFTFQTLA